jgi:predicted nucleotidyltransferase
MEKFEVFRTNIGSHMWKMNRPDSDEDIAIVYLANSRDILLTNRIDGKQTITETLDTTYYELGKVIQELKKGNVNFLWVVMSPIIISEFRNLLKELRQIVAENAAKNCYYSIKGLAKHNIYHFIEKGDQESALYKKKLNVIARTIQFGINILLYGKYLFERTDIQTKNELDDLVIRLDQVYQSSTLPKDPSPEPFDNFLIKWRLWKIDQDFRN